MKAAAAAAACFVVVFASVSMYNDGIGSLPEQSRSLESSGKTDILAVESSVAPQEGENRKDLGSHEEDIAQDQGLNRYDLHSAAVMSGAAGNVASPRAGFDATEPNPEESGINYSAEITEADTLCREGGKFVETTEEGYLTYRKLVDEYLTGYEFEYVTYKKDHSTGVYLFELRILKDPEGRIVDAPLILIGEQGEIHEQQTEQQSTDSEPVSGGERSAEDGQDSQKPQDDSD